MSGCGVDDDVFLHRGVVRHVVVFPCRDAFSQQCEGIFACRFLLVHLDGEVVHFAADVSEVLRFAEVIHHTVYGNRKQHRIGRNRLRYDNGTEYVILLIGDGSCLRYLAGSGDTAVGQVDDGITFHVLDQHLFFQSGPFAVGKAFAFGQGDARTAHAVAHGQADDVLSRSYVGSLAPQEVAGFVATHFVGRGSGRLVFLHFKGVGIHVFGRSEGIITVDVDVGMVVFPIDVVGRVPFVGSFVKGVLHVVAPVPAGLQGAGSIPLIVYYVDAHFVTVAKSVVVHAGSGHLLYFTRQLDGASAVSFRAIGTERIVVACGHGRQQCP